MPSKPPQVQTPLRILVLSLPSTPLPILLEGSTLPLSTPYYNASVPIWHDALPASKSELQKWEEDWREDPARDVVRAVGAWILVVKTPVGEEEGLSHMRSILTTISCLLSHHATPYSSNSEPLRLVVSLQQSRTSRLQLTNEECEDLCRECGGWEWIDGDKEGGEDRNEFGEKFGLGRMKEALEANEWEDGVGNEDSGSSLDLGDEAQAGFEVEATEMEGEIMSLKTSIYEVGKKLLDEDHERDMEDGDDIQVQGLEILMSRMQAIKDLGADMPEAERRIFAANAVKGVMKIL